MATQEDLEKREINVTTRESNVATRESNVTMQEKNAMGNENITPSKKWNFLEAYGIQFMITILMLLLIVFHFVFVLKNSGTTLNNGFSDIFLPILTLLGGGLIGKVAKWLFLI